MKRFLASILLACLPLFAWAGQQVLFTVVPDANWAAICAVDCAPPTGVTGLIQGWVENSGFTYYITANTTRPASSLYAMMLMPNGSFIVNQAKQARLAVVM